MNYEKMTKNELIKELQKQQFTRTGKAIYDDVTDPKKEEKNQEELLRMCKEISVIVSRSPAVAFLWKNVEGWPVEFVSGNVEKIFGYSSDEFISGSIRYDKVVLPEDLDRVAGEVSKFSRDSNAVSFKHKPYRIITKKGVIKWIDDVTFIRRDKEGNITHYEGIVLDITDRKKAEKKLEESEEKFRSMIETTSDWVWEIDANGVFTYVSPKVKDFLGFVPEEVVGKSFFDFLQPDGREKIEHDFMEKIRMSEPIYYVENTRTHKNGTHILLETSAIPVLGEGGVPVGYRGIDRNITHRSEIKRMRNEHEKMYDRLFAENQSIMLLIDPETGFIVDANQRACSFYGYEREKIRSMKIFDFNTLPEEKVDEEMKRAKELKRNYFNFCHRISDGRIRNVEVYSGPIPIHGKKTLLSVVHDITDRKNREEEESKSFQRKLKHTERMSNMGKLSAGVAHELNEPLTSILGFAELVNKNLDMPRKIKNDIDNIIDASKHARKIIKELLTFARQPSQQNSIYSINKIIGHELQFIKSKLEKRGLTLETSFSEDIPVILADRDHLRQVLVNLLNNSMDSMSDGGRLTLKTEANDKHVILTFGDTGTGMSEEVRKNIFNPFFTTKETGKGTGLGLSMVHGIITEHNGDIEVESKVGEGTVFKIKIPVFKNG